MSQLNSVIRLHAVVEWAGLDVNGVLALVDVMQAVVDGMTPTMVEGMEEGAVGGFQKEVVAVVLTENLGTVTGMVAASMAMWMVQGLTTIGASTKG